MQGAPTTTSTHLQMVNHDMLCMQFSGMKVMLDSVHDGPVEIDCKIVNDSL